MKVTKVKKSASDDKGESRAKLKNKVKFFRKSYPIEEYKGGREKCEEE